MVERQSFPPLVWEDSETLILGTIPSTSSIEKGEYYYHHTNNIWDYLAKIYDEPRPRTWQEKKEFLRRHYIALWDMYAYSEMAGSMDKGLGEFNNLSGFLEEHRTITKVLLNGKKASQAFRQYKKVGHILSDAIKVYFLWSTSGTNTRVPKEIVFSAWKDALFK